MMTSIYRGAGVNINVNVLETSEITRKLNGEDICKLQIESTAVLDLGIGDYVTVFSRNYYLNLLPEVTKSGRRIYKYDCIFESRQYELGKVIFMDPVQGGEFAYTGDLDFFVTQLVTNMNRLSYSGWVKGSVAVGTLTKSLQFSNENCLSALQRLCEEYELTFEISEVKEISVVATSVGTTLSFSYGKGKGLYTLNRKLIDSANIITRVYAFGSQRNIVANYRNGSARLKMPAPGYLEQNVGLYGTIEGVKVWDEIYPRYNGSVTGVSSPTLFRDTSIDFDLNSYKVPGTIPKVHFNSGLLSGYEFEIMSFDFATKYITLKETQQEKVTDTLGVLTPLVLPNSTLGPYANDKYVFIDIVMPETSTLHYVTAAETELYNKAVAFLAENSIPRVAYDLDIDPTYMSDNGYTLNMGEYVTIVDTELGINRAVRIIGLTRNLWYPNKYTVEIGDQLEPNLYNKMIGEVDDIKRLITVNKLGDLSRAKNAWRNTNELRNMIFGTDDYFDPEHIRPESIETNMLSVGSRASSFALNGSVFEPNLLGNPANFNIGAGILTHFTIGDTGTISWAMPAFSVTGLTAATAYYIYAKCARSAAVATYIVSSTIYKMDSDANYYYFLLGILHSVVSSIRDISLTYGNTRINGRTITTGRIGSANGTSYFDLDTNTIVMNGGSAGGFTVDTASFKFTKVDGGITYLLGLSNLEIISATTYHGRGLSLYKSDSAIANEIKVISVGQIRNLNTANVFGATSEYGFEIIARTTGTTYRHLVRMGGGVNMIAGWNIDFEAIFSGPVSEKVSSGYTSSAGNMTIHNNGSIHSRNFYINADGSVAMKNAKFETLSESRGGYLQNIVIDQYGISEQLAAFNTACVEINRVGYQGAASYFRNLFVYDGKGNEFSNTLLSASGAGNQVYVGGRFGVGKTMEFSSQNVLNTQAISTNISYAIYASASIGTIYLPEAPGTGHILIVINPTVYSCTISLTTARINAGERITNGGVATDTTETMPAYRSWGFIYIGTRWMAIFYK